MVTTCFPCEKRVYFIAIFWSVIGKNNQKIGYLICILRTVVTSKLLSKPEYTVVCYL